MPYQGDMLIPWRVMYNSSLKLWQSFWVSMFHFRCFWAISILLRPARCVFENLIEAFKKGRTNMRIPFIAGGLFVAQWNTIQYCWWFWNPAGTHPRLVVVASHPRWLAAFLPSIVLVKMRLAPNLRGGHVKRYEKKYMQDGAQKNQV